MHTLHARRHVTKTGAKLWWTCDLLKCRVCCWFGVVHTVLKCCCRIRREGQRKASFLFSSLFAYLCVMAAGFLSLSFLLSVNISRSLFLCQSWHLLAEYQWYWLINPDSFSLEPILMPHYLAGQPVRVFQ